MRRVGIVGLGDMGMGMARNIVKAGSSLSGFDLREERLAELEKEGGSRASSCREVGELSDSVFVMVLNGDQVKEVIFGDDGLTKGLKPGATIIVSAVDIKAANRPATTRPTSPSPRGVNRCMAITP